MEAIQNIFSNASTLWQLRSTYKTESKLGGMTPYAKKILEYLNTREGQEMAEKIKSRCEREKKSYMVGLEGHVQIELHKIFHFPLIDGIRSSGGFKKVRPEWMRNPESGRKLELDLYSDMVSLPNSERGEKVKLAVEIQGRQHTQNIDHFYHRHGGEEGFTRAQRRDAIKRELCAKNGVFLIEVPYNIKAHELPIFLLSCISEISSLMGIASP